MVEIKSFRGKTIDISSLRLQNEKSVSLGNMGVNARGDKLGKGGEIIQTREEIIRDHYQKNPQPVKQVSIYEDPMADREAEIRKEAEEGTEDLLELQTKAAPVVPVEEEKPKPKKAKKKKTAKKVVVPTEEDEHAAIAAAAAADQAIEFKG